jgi:hypothetical protein
MTKFQTIIVVVVFIDIVITALIVRRWLKKLGGEGLLGVELTKFRAFSDSIRDLTSNYMTANYSGDPESLAPVLTELMSQLDAKAKEQGITLNREALKMVLMRSIMAQKNVPMRDMQNALKKVA